jgi:hypothetical protein
LVFPSSAFFSTGASAPGAPAFPSGPAGPDCPSGPAGAGAAGAGGGGGFTTVSSFLLQPANVRVKAKSVTLDNKTIFFPIFSSPPFPSHICRELLVMSSFYYISLADFQAEFVSTKTKIAAKRVYWHEKTQNGLRSIIQ